MKKLTYTPLPYTTNSSQLFECFAHLPYSMFLDSCYPLFPDQRYDIIVALPSIIFTHDNKITTIETELEKHTIKKEPFSVIKKYLKEWRKEYDITSSSFPFTIGAVGYFGYDVEQSLEKLPHLTQQDILLPSAAVGLYEWSIVVDHYKKETWLITGFNHLDPKFQKIKNFLDESSSTPFSFLMTKPFRSNITKKEYAFAFDRLQNYIYAGDCYQVNFCQRFSAEYQGSEWQAYQWLRENNPAPYSAFIHIPQGKILSLSPERFLQIKNRFVETQPIKGTAPRFVNTIKDKQSAEDLLKSEKDRAENLMIVDLLRNDLGKTCKPGSIRVPELFALKSFPNVHHLVSTVIGELEDHVHALDVLRHAFPGGSITGAPKIRAMEIIEELEKHHRSIYCGSIGYIDINENMDSNITIRTFICNQHKIYCYSGGGIVSDSIMEKEYSETLIKVEKLIKLLEILSRKNQNEKIYERIH